MSSLLNIKVTPLLSMTQKEAVEALGGLDALHILEREWGLRPWRAQATRRCYSVASIQAALDRAEQGTALEALARKAKTSSPSDDQSTAAE